MTTERDPGARIVLSWLREDAHENAERVLLRALDEVESTPQRRSWWPARRPFMSTYAKVVAAAAALVVVAVVGYNLLPGTGIGGPATPSPTATPGPTPISLSSDDNANLVAGRYVTGNPFPVRISATVPPGWHGHVAGPYYADLWTTPGVVGGLYFVLPGKVAADPCDYNKGFVDVPGSTVDALTSALRGVPGIQVNNVAGTEVSGYRGTSLTVTAPADISGCTVSPEGYVIWQLPLGGISPALTAGESIRVWILDVAGQRTVIALQDKPYNAADRAATQAVFDSIRIEPAS
jgi:hypothetical protein